MGYPQVFYIGVCRISPALIVVSLRDNMLDRMLCHITSEVRRALFPSEMNNLEGCAASVSHKSVDEKAINRI